MATKKKRKLVVKKKNLVTFKQESFCQAWVDLKGNGTQAAIVAFDIKGKEVFTLDPPKPIRKTVGKVVRITNKKDIEKYWKLKKLVETTAAVMANEYLRKPKIWRRIDEILDERGFTDETVKREHFKLIIDAEDKVKKGAIDSYYKLKGKFLEKVKHEGEINFTWQK